MDAGAMARGTGRHFRRTSSTTNDLDYYMNLRAVCHHWRSITADPAAASNQHEPRFHPNRWVMLDEHRVSLSSSGDGDDDTRRLFVNRASGRFLHMSLPLLSDNDFVTSTTGGHLVLASMDASRAARVLNPFTSSLVRFAAPVPDEQWLRAEVVVGPRPSLVLVCILVGVVYRADDPNSESFSVEYHLYPKRCPASRLPLIAAAKHAAVGRQSDTGADKMVFDQLLRRKGCRYYVVELMDAGGQFLAVLRRHDDIDVFKIDSAGNVMERVRSIGSLALFLGIRCFAVDADSFPNIEANCVYFQSHSYIGDGLFIYKIDIASEDEEQAKPQLVENAIKYDSRMVSVEGAVTDSIFTHEDGYSHRWVSIKDGMEYNRRVYAEDCKDPCWAPFTVTQVLCNYTMNFPCRQPRREIEILSYEDFCSLLDNYIRPIRSEDEDDRTDLDWDWDGELYAAAARAR